MAEHFHGKEGVVGSIPTLGSRKELMKKLYRSTSDRKVAGICAGAAAYLDIDVTLVRLIVLVLTVITGFIPGIVAYLLAIWVVPVEGESHA